jgi:hypothetical protein
MKKLILTAFSLAAIIGLTACNKLDIIGDTSITSFDKVISTAGDKVTEDQAYGGWFLQAPDGEVRFIWSKDDSNTTMDALLEVDAQPFIDAGLDIAKLPKGMLVGDKLVIGTDFGSDEFIYEGNVTPATSFAQIVTHNRRRLNYHTALDHFGIDLSGGNAFEFAKDMTKNDKDIVYVLNPQTFIDAGVDPANVNGWVFAKVETMDQNGKKIEVDKFLKPFDLDGLQ